MANTISRRLPSAPPGPSLVALLVTALLLDTQLRGIKEQVFAWHQATGLDVREWACTPSTSPSMLTVEVDASGKGVMSQSPGKM